ncbi:MAG: response regulator [Gammaproteobacteria bacterium]|nr:response regulator [Gammaproteobacteria bacterium]
MPNKHEVSQTNPNVLENNLEGNSSVAQNPIAQNPVAQNPIAQNNAINNLDAFLTSLCDANPDPLLITNKDDQVIKCNKLFHQQFGYADDDLQSIKFSQLLFPADFREIYLEEFYRHSNSEKKLPPLSIIMCLWIMNIYGETNQYDCRRYSLILNHHSYYITTMQAMESEAPGHEEDGESFDDLVQELEGDNLINEQKILINSLNDALELANDAAKAKDQFLANMSHEIRSPMNIVLGMSRLLSKTELNDKQFNYIEKIESASVSLLGTINDILDFSKIEAHKLLLEEHPFNLVEVIKNIENMIEFKAEEKKLSYQISIADDVPIFLIGDPLRINQILNNLSFNAIKFTSAGSIEIKVELEAMARSTDEEDLTLRFSVTDTGIGLTKAEQSRLFQAFQQADNSITRQYGGTGLGLAISKELAELMGGKIGINSEKGVGSTFFFTSKFKLQSQQMIHEIVNTVTDSEKLDEKLSLIKGAKVLLVDDILGNQELAMELLQDVYLDVVIASNGQEAINRIKETATPFDLVLMDLQMPIMDGYEATKQIYNTLGLKDLPIIAMTANAMASDRQKTLEAGMVDHIAKPIDVEELYQCLVKWIKPESAVNKVEQEDLELKELLDEYIKVAGEQTSDNKQEDLNDKSSIPHVCPIILLLASDQDFIQKLEFELGDKYYIISTQQADSIINMAIENHPSLVAIDSNTPNIDILELSKQIKQHRELNQVSIAVFSDNHNKHTESNELIEFLSAGIDERIIKSSNTADMAEKIVQLLQSHEAYLETIQPSKLIDPYTKLPNNIAFEQELVSLWNHGIKQQSPLTMLYIKINSLDFDCRDFHHTVENLKYQLLEITKIIKDLLSRPSDLLCRFDNNLLCVLSDTHKNGASRIANSIWETINALEIPSSDIFISTNINICIGSCTAIPSKQVAPQKMFYEAILEMSKAELLTVKQVSVSDLVFQGKNIIHTNVEDTQESFTPVVPKQPNITTSTTTSTTTSNSKEIAAPSPEALLENNSKQKIPSEQQTLLKGIDKEAALKRVRGKEKLFNSLLKNFVYDFALADEVIEEALQGNQDLELAQRTAHSVKGMSGNISAQELFDASLALEMGIKNNQQSDWPELFDNFKQHLQIVLNSIAAYQNDNADIATSDSENTPSSEPLNIEAITPVINQLVEQLEQTSLDADETFEQLKALFSNEYHSQLNAIADAMEQLDYDTAKDLLGNFSTKHGLM